ncbi:hypothetical protein GH714_034818 [Hevea brasiliensis]|uniref:Uncharacterized protein n=1 Tax=Hevea brasiliensis TaxID=3981 RepID=A0A6A6MJA9_HEVBR|nr:hypothetical protein GH714_034818 [Hevea brasiliensis]
MAREEIVKNVVAAINGIMEIVTRKWSGRTRKRGEVEKERVKEEKVRRKGRIHEVRYMDSHVNRDDIELNSDGEGDTDNAYRSYNDNNGKKGSSALEVKKRKKGEEGKNVNKIKVKKEDGVKQKKNVEKTKNEDAIKQKKHKKDQLASAKLK